MIAHMPEPEMMNRFRQLARMMKPMMAGKPVRPAPSSASATVTAIQVPIPDQLNRAMKLPRMKASTMNGSISLSASDIILTASRVLRRVPRSEERRVGKAGGEGGWGGDGDRAAGRDGDA